MTPILTTLAPGLLEAGSRLIDRLVPDPVEREKAKLALLQAEGQLALQEMQTSLSAILAEANSQDPWTSRARPTFLYVIYLDALVPGAQHARGPQGKTCLTSSWLNPLRVLSLHKNRGDSTVNNIRALRFEG